MKQMSQISISEARFEALLRLAVIENFKNELQNLPSKEELDKIYTFSKEHEKRMKRLFLMERWYGFIHTAAKFSRRAAIFILCIFILLFGALLTNKDVRAAVHKTVVEWFDKFTRFNFSGDADSVTAEANKWEPQYLPIGFTESQEYVFGGAQAIEYINTDGDLITFIYSLADSSTINVDNEHTDYSLTTIKGVDYYVFDGSQEGRNTNVIWEYEGMSFHIEALLDKDELLKK